jgi:hypothetical protein
VNDALHKLDSPNDRKLDHMQLSVEGGSLLDKNHKTLEEYSVKDGEFILLEIVEKIKKKTSAKNSTKRDRKPKEKVVVLYQVQGGKHALHNNIEIPKGTKVRVLKKLILTELGMPDDVLKVYQHAKKFNHHE